MKDNKPSTRYILPVWLNGPWGGIAIFFTAYILVYLGWINFHWGGEENVSLIGDLFYLPLDIVSTIAAWQVFTRKDLDPRVRRLWLLLGLALFSYFLGDVIWTYLENVLETPLFPSVADVFYLLFAPLATIGLLSTPSAPENRTKRWQYLSDLLIVITAAGMLIWRFIIEPTAAASTGDFLAQAISIAYPLTDLILIGGIVGALLSKPDRDTQSALWLLFAGMIFFVGSDIIFGYTSLAGTYKTGSWVDAGWNIARLFFLFAALRQMYQTPVESRNSRFMVVLDGFAQGLPIIAVVLGIIVAVSVVTTDLDAQAGWYIAGAILILVLAFLNQFVRRLWDRGSVQTKIVLWAGIGFFLSAAFIIGYAAFILQGEISRSTEASAQEIARANAAEIRIVLEKSLGSAQTFAQSVLVVKTEGVQLSREQVNAMLRQLLKDNPQFVGVDVLWEPNAFDGRDSEFTNTEGSNANGRFLPYWTRSSTGGVQVELLQDYDTSDWYQCPKTTKVPCLTDPLVYPVQGKDVLMTSLVVPFVVDGNFYGITGVDTPVTFLQEIADSADIFDGKGVVAILSNNGTILGVTGRPELVGQPATLLHEHFSAEDYRMIKNGEEELRYSPDGMLEAFIPIKVGDTVTPWSVNVIVPRDIIFADATRQMQNLIAIGGGLLFLSLIVLFYAARQIAQPIHEITEVALMVAGGNLDVVANVNSTDETGVLANAFNQMTAQLRDLIGSLEERVAARTKDLAAVAEVGTATSTILETDKLLQAVVELTKERFNLYHSHIYLLDDAGKNLVLAAGAGEPGRIMAAERRSIPLDREQSLVARAARERKGVTVNDVTQEPDFLPNPLLPNTRSELAVPMVVGSNLIGVFDIQSDEVGRFTNSDIDIQTTLAAQVATSIQNVRSFEQFKAQADLEALVNTIGQKIQRATSVEDTLQTAIREIGLALSATRVQASLTSRQTSSGDWNNN